MCNIATKNYHHGLLLMKMCAAGKSPRELDTSGMGISSPVYWLPSDGEGKGQAYIAKRVKAGKSVSGRYDRWSYVFTDKEVRDLVKLHDAEYDAFVCLVGFVEDGEPEMAFISYKDAIDCLGVKLGTRGTRSISVRRAPRGKYLRLHGSGRADKIGGKDNSIPVKRNAVPSL